MGTEKVYADLQAAVAEAVAAMTEQRGRGYASDKESWADLAKRVEECDDLLKNIKKVQRGVKTEKPSPRTGARAAATTDLDTAACPESTDGDMRA